MTSPRLTLAATMLAAAALVAGCSSKSATADAATGAAAGARPAALVLPAAQRERVHVTTLAPQVFAPEVHATGTVAFDGDMSTPVLAPISGPITRIVVQPGTFVSKGDPLAYVTSPDYAAAVAAYRKADATAKNLQHIATLDSALFANDAIARRDLEQAQTDAVSANADRDAALAALRSLGVRETTIAALQANQPVGAVEGVIRAPLAGTVVERLVTPGQLIQAGSTPCFTVADLSRMWVMTSVFEPDLPAVHLGDEAEVATNLSDGLVRGRVDNISPQVDSTTKATLVRVVVPNAQRLLKKDMYVRVTIRSHLPRSGLLVPVSAVLRDEDNRPFVYIQNAQGAFERRTIALGPRVGTSFEVRDGLQAGDRLVSEGGLFLQFAESQ